MYNESKIEGFISSQILGDGYITKKKQLVIRHAEKYIDYLKLKRDYLHELGLKVGEIRSYDNISQLGHYRLCELSIKLNHYFQTCPIENIYNLDSFGLLLWWCDDGSLTISHKRNGKSVSRFGYLNTQAFDLKTNELISEALFDRFDLKTSIHIDKGGVSGRDSVYYRQYLNATNMRLLIDIVRPHICKLPSCMLYKLNMGYFPTIVKTSEEYALKYNF